MCGFAGYLSPNRFESKALLLEMGHAIQHRGPDAVGTWFDEENGIGFCHRRLSILDLSAAGAQPMSSRDSRYILVFNGEIYNFKDLRHQLDQELNGVDWQGHSDTEVILAGFQSWGLEKTLKKMIGMFAIALWDLKTKQLFLARDRIGEKPLYYGWQNETFLFGSELKSFHAHPEFRRDLCLDALGNFFKYNYVPSGTSIYKGIKKLEPGTWCKVSLTSKEVIPVYYWRLENKIHPIAVHPGKIEDYVNQLEDLLKNAVASQMISDVPLGAFLSGGVDSSAIVALMQQQSNRPIQTFSIGFNEEGFDEAVYAKEVARFLGTDHTEMYVTPEDALNVVPSLPEIYDEPFSDSSQIPTYLVSKLAKTKVTVSLSGDAGDELFSGYNRYLMVNSVWSKLALIPLPVRRSVGKFLIGMSTEQLNLFYRQIQRAIPSKYRLANFADKIHKFASRMDASNISQLYDGFVSHWNVEEILKEPRQLERYDFNQISHLSAIEKMMYLDTKTYLPNDILVKVDRAAMANSLETRVPFLDHRIVEFAWKMPMSLKIRENKGKWLLREVLYRHVPKNLIERPKMGFGVPLDSWLRGPLKDWTLDLLSRDSLRKHGFLNEDAIAKKVDEHLSGQKNWQYLLWDVLMFQSWYNRYHS